MSRSSTATVVAGNSRRPTAMPSRVPGRGEDDPSQIGGRSGRETAWGGLDTATSGAAAGSRSPRRGWAAGPCAPPRLGRLQPDDSRPRVRGEGDEGPALFTAAQSTATPRACRPPGWRAVVLVVCRATDGVDAAPDGLPFIRGTRDVTPPRRGGPISRNVSSPPRISRRPPGRTAPGGGRSSTSTRRPPSRPGARSR